MIHYESDLEEILAVLRMVAIVGACWIVGLIGSTVLVTILLMKR